jgi:hypothetical protein
LLQVLNLDNELANQTLQDVVGAFFTAMAYDGEADLLLQTHWDASG